MVPADLRPALLPQIELPVGPEGIVKFRTKCELAVDCFRARPHNQGQAPAVFDGGYALRSMVRPLVLPEGGAPRIDFLTRLRRDARLFALPLPAEQLPRGSGVKSPTGVRSWSRPAGPAGGKRSGNSGPPSSTAGSGHPLEGDRLPVAGPGLGGAGQSGRCFRPGVKERFTLVASAIELTGLQMVELFAARSARGRLPRPGAAAGLGGVPGVDGEPDRADQSGQSVTMSLLRMLQFRLKASESGLVVPATVEQEEG